MRRVFLDTETTGMNSAEDRIVSVGCVAYEGREPLAGDGAEFSRFINPRRKVEIGAVQVHGLTDEFLVEYPPFSDCAAALADFVRGAEVVIHNAAFDEGFLNAEFARLQMPPLAEAAEKVICSLELAKRLVTGAGGYSLDKLCGHFGVDNSMRETHGALLDARLLAQVYVRMTRRQMALDMRGAPAPAAAEGGEEEKEIAVRVLRASEKENAAHESLLDAMEKETGAAPVGRR